MKRFVVILLIGIIGIVLAGILLPEVRSWVIGSLRGEPRVNGMPAGFWVHTLQTSPDPVRRVKAAQSLENLGPSYAESDEVLRESLQDSDPEVRLAVIHAIGVVGTSDLDRKTLASCLTDPNSQARAAAANALGQLGVTEQSTIDALKKQAKQDGDVQAKVAAILALGKIGPAANSAIPQLIESLLEPDSTYGSPHGAAVFSLSQLCQKDQTALVAALNRKEERLRGGALKTLGTIGPDAKSALPRLVEITKTAEPIVQLEAAQAAFQISKSPELTLTVAKLHMNPANQKNQTLVRVKALYVLSELGPPAEPLVPDIIRMMKDDPEFQVRNYAAIALGKIGKSKVIIDALQDTAHHDKDPEVCATANAQLKNLNP